MLRSTKVAFASSYLAIVPIIHPPRLDASSVALAGGWTQASRVDIDSGLIRERHPIKKSEGFLL